MGAYVLQTSAKQRFACLKTAWTQQTFFSFSASSIISCMSTFKTEQILASLSRGKRFVLLWHISQTKVCRISANLANSRFVILFCFKRLSNLIRITYSFSIFFTLMFPFSIKFRKYSTNILYNVQDYFLNFYKSKLIFFLSNKNVDLSRC